MRALLLVMLLAGSARAADYPWPHDPAAIPLEQAIAPPPGFVRVPLAPDSYGAWLRGLPTRPAGTPVRSYKGRVILEGDDPRLGAVVDLDLLPADRDWQQCNDSIIRLDAEWRWASGQTADLAYFFTSGDRVAWARHAAGWRPSWDGKAHRMTWARRGKAASSYQAFHDYLALIFLYAGTTALAREGQPVARADLAPGDFFIWPGPSGKGHGVQVLDVAVDAQGRRRALIGQGYVPAQDFHVVRDPASGSPWIGLDGDSVATPFWSPFQWDMLRRF